MSVTSSTKTEQQADLPSQVPTPRASKSKSRSKNGSIKAGSIGKGAGNRTNPLPPEWEVAIEIGEDEIYPPLPNGKAKPLDTSVALDVSTAFLDATPYSIEEPWGLMEGESSRDYQLFSHYRAQGLGRVKLQVAKHFKLSPPVIYRAAEANDWDHRCRAWDVYREKIYTAELVEQTRDMAKVHSNVARKGILALASAFENLVERMEADPELWKAGLEEIPTKQLMTIAQRSAQVIPNLMNAERLSRGMPTELISTHSTVDHNVNLQTTDDLALLLAGLFGAIGGRENADGSDRPYEVIDAVVIDDGGGEGEDS